MMGKGELGIKVCNWLIKEKEFDLKCIVPVIPEPDWSESIIDYAKSKNITYLDSRTMKTSLNLLMLSLCLI